MEINEIENRKTIEKISETKLILLKNKWNLQAFSKTYQAEKGENTIRNEDERLQLTLQKYKGSLKNTQTIICQQILQSRRNG